MLTLPADWKDRYLALLRETKLETAAAAAVGMTARRIRKECENDMEFAEAVESVVEEIADYYEDAARVRAVEGIERGVYFKGEKVDTERTYSDTLLQAFLKAKRRREFGDKQEITSNQPVVVHVRDFTQIEELL